MWQGRSSLQAQPLMKYAPPMRSEDGVHMATIASCDRLRPVYNLGGRCYMAAALNVALNTKLFNYLRPEVQQLKDRPQALGNFKCVCQSDHACSLQISAIARKLSLIEGALDKSHGVSPSHRTTQDGGIVGTYFAAIVRDNVRSVIVDPTLGIFQVADAATHVQSVSSERIRQVELLLPRTDIVMWTIRLGENLDLKTSTDLDRTIARALPPVVKKYWTVAALTFGVSIHGDVMEDHAVAGFRCVDSRWFICDPNSRTCTPLPHYFRSNHAHTVLMYLLPRAKA